MLGAASVIEGETMGVGLYALLHVCLSVCVCMRVCTRTPPSAVCPSSLPVLEAGGGDFLPCSIQEAENRGQAVVLKDGVVAGEVT